MSRVRSILNLGQYDMGTRPELVGRCHLHPPEGDQQVLRVLVESPYSSGLKLPSELEWLWPALDRAHYAQDCIGIRHPFTYITVRSGTVVTKTDDEWHVDGFSTKYTHLPEANYVIVMGHKPTQFLAQTFDFPDDFDPRVHNIHKYFQHEADPKSVEELDLDTIYLLDPYVIHRRPPDTQGTQRTFVRISFTPIEIPDIHNTPNPAIPTAHYVTDGVADFRDGLLDYHKEIV